MTYLYQKHVDESNKSGNERKNPPPYFEELHEIYGYRPNVKPLATIDTENPKTVKQKWKATT